MDLDAFWNNYNNNAIDICFHQVTGDVFTYVNEGFALAHCVSSDLSMRGGFAKVVRSYYGVHSETLQFRKPFGQVGYCIKQITSNVTIFHLVTKGKYYNKPTFHSIFNALLDLRRICAEQKIRHVVMPQIASGLNKKPWEVISKMISFVFDGADVEVVVVVKPKPQQANQS